MAVTAPIEIDRSRLLALIEHEGARLNECTAASKAMYERAHRTLSGGVVSSYQVREPWPIYLAHGAGQRVWDVDGTEYFDFHNGFGSMTQGHAHPAVMKAIQERTALGTHFAAPTEDGSSSPKSSLDGSGCRSGATRTPARRRRWTRSGSRADTRAVRSSSRSSTPTVATTTR